MLVPIEILLLVLAVMFFYFGYSANHVSFEVSQQGLRIRGALYARFVPAESMVPDKARELNLLDDPDYRIAFKTNGVNLPGYTAGWFRLRNSEKALVFVTDRSRAVYVPTVNGYSLLLSPQDPQGFLASLRQGQEGR
jgi:hypothetical protein